MASHNSLDPLRVSWPTVEHARYVDTDCSQIARYMSEAVTRWCKDWVVRCRVHLSYRVEILTGTKQAMKDDNGWMIVVSHHAS